MAAVNGYVLAIDLGTSGPKAALVDTNGRIIDFETTRIQTFFLQDGGVEQDPHEWWAAIKDVIRGLLDRARISRSAILGISCSCQWGCTVAVDTQGRPLMNAISWMDPRGAKPLADIIDGPVKIEGYDIFKLYKWLRVSGGVPAIAGREPASHILFIKKARPDIYKATCKFLEARDYINYCLTGVFCTSPDAVTLNWVTDNRDIHHVKYHDGLIRMLGIDREKLPDIRPSGSVIGPVRADVAKQLGLDPSTLVAIGAPDLHAAAVGSGATADYAAHLYIGTSSWLLCHMPYQKTNLFHKMGSFPAAIPGKYLLLNEQEIAGGALNILKDNLGFGEGAHIPEETDIYSRFCRMAGQVPPGSGNLIFTPWFNGERSPVDDRHTRAGFHNMGLNTTRAHMVRAVFEGVAYNSKWLLTCVEKHTRRKMGAINMIGGGARNDIWCQIHADVLDRTIRRVKHPALGNARGAGLIGLAALGFMDFEAISEKIEFDAVFTPRPDNRDIYDTLFSRFVELYRANRKWHKKINQ